MLYSKPQIADVANAVNAIESVISKNDCNHPDVDVRPITVSAYEADE
jgi:hypothetical protein